MSLGDRCDEIVRLIDETLAAVAADGADEADGGLTPRPRLDTTAPPSLAPRWLSRLGRCALARGIVPPDADAVTEAGRVA